MRKTSLGRVLAGIVSTGTAVACGGGVTTPDCPHTVIDRQSTVNMTADEACKQAPNLVISFDYVSPQMLELCRQLCGDTTITTCHLPYGYLPTKDDAGATVCPTLDAGNTVALTCQVTHTEGTWTNGCPVAGRRTEGVHGGETGELRASLGDFFARCTALEATAVIAFRRLEAELVAFGAPADLIERARRATQDEIEHTDAMAWLTARASGSVPAITQDELPRRSLFDVALENAVEGRIRETFGAAVALHQARHAADGTTRRILTRIADEERAHAELAADLEQWFAEQLSADELARIESAKLAAIAELRAAHSCETDPRLVSGAGLPTRKQASALVDGLERLVWCTAAAA